MAKTYGGCGQARHVGKGQVGTYPLLCIQKSAAEALELARVSCLQTYPIEEGYSEHVVVLIGEDGEALRWEADTAKPQRPNPMAGMIDNRTPEQLEADGDDYWSDGLLYTPPQYKPEEFWPVDKPERRAEETE